VLPNNHNLIFGQHEAHSMCF